MASTASLGPSLGRLTNRRHRRIPLVPWIAQVLYTPALQALRHELTNAGRKRIASILYRTQLVRIHHMTLSRITMPEGLRFEK
jgi:hypothetical protein